jgi:hypothetical protein
VTEDADDKLEWIEGYLLMWSRSGAGVLIEFSDMDGPCWVPTSQLQIDLFDDGCYGPGVFGLPDWLVTTWMTVLVAEEAARAAAAAAVEEQAKAYRQQQRRRQARAAAAAAAKAATARQQRFDL